MSSSRKSRWCPLPNEAPPTIKDSNTGIVYWDDMHYGSKWETKLTEKGAITFELDEEDLFSQEKDRQLALEAQQLRLQRVREAVKTPVQPEGPTTAMDLPRSNLNDISCRIFNSSCPLCTTFEIESTERAVSRNISFLSTIYAKTPKNKNNQTFY